MIGKNSLFGLILVAIAVVAAVIYSTEREKQTHSSSQSLIQQPVFPQLLTRLNDVERISVKTAEQAFDVASNDGIWRVPQKSNYPADVSTVKSFLLSLARTKRLEGKTSNPELYSKLEVNDPDSPAAESAQFQIYDNNKKLVAGVIMGKQRPSASSAGQEYYARVEDDAQVWLVQGSDARKTTPIEWLNTSIITIDPNRFKQILISPSDAENFTIFRDSIDATDYQLADMADDEKVTYQYALNEVIGNFSSLVFEDVKKTDSVEFSNGISGVVETFDGLKILFESSNDENDTWFRFDVQAGESTELVQTDNTKNLEDALTQNDSLDKNSMADQGANLAAEASGNVEVLKAEVNRLNAALHGWAFMLPSYVKDSILKPRSELVEPIVEEADGAQADSSN